MQLVFPTEPLIKYIDHHLHGYDDMAKATALGATYNAYRTYRVRPTISWLQADKLATNLGIHPTSIWENWYEKEF